MNLRPAEIASRIGELSTAIVDDESTPSQLWHACDELYHLMTETGGLRAQEFDPAVARESEVQFGIAIAPMEAAHCLYDIGRTRAFARSVIEAIEQRLIENPAQPVHVVYAGCGPFATLLLPALHRFEPNEMQCTLIDVHERSIASLRRVVAACEFEPYIRTIEVTDASVYRIPADTLVDVIVVECLLRGLTREPQVSITWNLVDQAGPNVSLIPEEVRLDLVYVDRTSPGVAQPAIVRVEREPIFTLSVASVIEWGPMDPAIEVLPARSATMPALPSPDHHLGLATTICVRGDIELTDYMSGLTNPVSIDVRGLADAGSTLVFRYRLAPPGIDADCRSRL